jgi:hypothetical protein
VRSKAAICVSLFVASAPAQCAPDGAKLFELYQPATVCIVVRGERFSGETEIASRGSGFFLNGEDVVLTSSHVIPADLSRYKSAAIIGRVRVGDTDDDMEVALTLIDRDDVADIALLRSNGPIPSKHVYHGNSKQAKVGLDLVIIGCPLNFGPTLTRGSLGNLRDDPNGRWITEAPINPGNSGGPVFGEDGAVIGLATGGLRSTSSEFPVMGINFITPIHVALEGLVKNSKIASFDFASTQVSTSVPISVPANTMGPLSPTLSSPAPPSSASFPNATLGGLNSITEAIRNPVTASILPPPPTVTSATNVSATISASKRDASVTKLKALARAYEIRTIKEDHPPVTASNEDVRIRLVPEQGFKFDRLQFDELSKANASPPNIEVAPDGKSAEVTFRLTSGPVSDPFRGWITGTVLTKQVPD